MNNNSSAIHKLGWSDVDPSDRRQSQPQVNEAASFIMNNNTITVPRFVPQGEQAHTVNHLHSEEVPMFRKLFSEESGQDMIEYALLASFISIVAIATLRLIGPLIVDIYNDISAALA